MTEYVIRDVRQAIRETQEELKGDTSDYARGWRAALRAVDLRITKRLKED